MVGAEVGLQAAEEGEVYPDAVLMEFVDQGESAEIQTADVDGRWPVHVAYSVVKTHFYLL